MGESQLFQGYSAYVLPLSHEFLIPILCNWEGWKAQSILELLSGFDPETPGLVIRRPNH